LGSHLDAYLPYLHARWAQGIQNPTVLWREIRTQEYPGTSRMIEGYLLRLSQRLKGLAPQQCAHFLQIALTFKTPTLRHLTAWVQMAHRKLTPKQAQFLTHLSTVSSEVRETRERTLTFRQLMKKRLRTQFSVWLEQPPWRRSAEVGDPTFPERRRG